MKIAVLINNYNYEKYIFDCLSSVVNQTRLPDQIIFVDDGSTDESIETVLNFITKNKNLNLTLVEKKNGGQLSAFNSGFEALDACIDLVCFLDCDDKYHPTYLENLEKTAITYKSCEAFFSSYNYLYESGKIKSVVLGDYDLPPQFLQTVFANRFNGVPTSMVSFRKRALEEILPYPDHKEWRIRADDILVYLASAKMMARRYMPEPLVFYRIHGSNLFQGKKRNPNIESKRTFSLAKVLQPYREQFYKLTYTEMRNLIIYEFSQEKSILKSTFRFISILLVLKIPIIQIPRFILAFIKAKVIGLFK